MLTEEYMSLIHGFEGEIQIARDVTFAVSSRIPGTFTVIISSILVF